MSALPDYLEELLDNAAALLEQVKLLERELSGLMPGARAMEAEEYAPAAGAETGRGETYSKSSALMDVFEERQEVSRIKNLVYEADRAENQVEEPVFPRREREEPEKLPQSGASSPLLEQLGRLERAASAPALLQAGAVRTAGPGFDPLPAVRTGGGLGPTGSAGEAWRGGGGLEGYAAPEEELRWAERADRVFRRDSRRYDGGFYLF